MVQVKEIEAAAALLFIWGLVVSPVGRRPIPNQIYDPIALDKERGEEEGSNVGVSETNIRSQQVNNNIKHHPSESVSFIDKRNERRRFYLINRALVTTTT